MSVHTLLTCLLDGATGCGLTDTQVEQVRQDFNALERDAQRFRGIVMCLTEPDEVKRDAMIAAVDSHVSQLQPPDNVCQAIDEILLVAAKARDAANRQT